MNKDQWREIVQKSGDLVWRIEVQSLDDDSTKNLEVPFVDTIENAGLLIGRSSDCNVVLSDTTLPSRAAKIWAASNHIMVDVLKGTVTLNEDRTCNAGSSMRFDGEPLLFSRFKVTVRF